MSDEIAYATIRELGTRYRARQLSPVEVTRAMLARIEKIDPALNAYVTLTADRGQIRQALVNLIQNGLEAIGPGGKVTVSAQADGDRLTIVVADSGPGLSAERAADLFVPNLTTKAHGSGLGLTIVQRIVNDHRGSVAAESAPGRGTTFRIVLPLEPGA